MKKKIKTYWRHETKKSILIRFLLILFIFIAYSLFVIFRYGFNNGILVAFLTWSFFVFCTPIADAGLLLDFPIRFITGIRMLYTEIFVWITAFLLNFFNLIFNPFIYEKTFLLKMFKYILLHPIPFYAIILLSAIGTFMSIYFGDELIDIAKHKERRKYFKHKGKYEIVLFLFLFLVIFFLYRALLKYLGINIF